MSTNRHSIPVNWKEAHSVVLKTDCLLGSKTVLTLLVLLTRDVMKQYESMTRIVVQYHLGSFPLVTTNGIRQCGSSYRQTCIRFPLLDDSFLSADWFNSLLFLQQLQINLAMCHSSRYSLPCVKPRFNVEVAPKMILRTLLVNLKDRGHLRLSVTVKMNLSRKT